MSTWKNFLTAAVLVLVAGTATACRRHAAREPERLVVQVIAAAPASTAARPHTDYIGLARGNTETDLGFKVGGVLELIGPSDPNRSRPADGSQDWQEGAPVRAGEVLARLKQQDFVSQVRSDEARAGLDELSLQRNQKLREQGAISPQELDVIAANAQASKAKLAQARQALEDSVIHAPYQGHVLLRLANACETILPGHPVLRVADLSRIAVEIGVPDKLIGQVRVGKLVRLEFPALPGRKFDGLVSEVGVSAKEGARLFRVIIKVDNQDGALKSGMTATVSLEDEQPAPPGAVLVPISALVSPAQSQDPNQLAVFVVDATGHARERRVKTRDLVRSSVQIISGVQAGEKVVVAGASTLHDGAPVTIQATEKFW